MKVIVPAAGRGTRMRPLTNAIPKILLPLAGRTVLDFLMDDVLALEPDEIIFIVNYLKDEIEQYLREHYDVPLRFVLQEDFLGLGHAVSLGAPYLAQDEHLMIVLGDTVFRTDLKPVRDNPNNVICVKKVEDASRFGIVELDESGHITRLVEKPKQPPTDLAIVGIYSIRQSGMLFAALQRNIASGVRSAGEIQLTDALQEMLHQGAVFEPGEIGQWLDCGKFETTLETNRVLLELLQPQPPATGQEVTVIPPVAIPADCSLHHCRIGPHVSLGPGCSLHGVTISNSVVGNHAQLADVELQDSFLGDHVQVRAAGARLRLRLGNYSDLSP